MTASLYPMSAPVIAFPVRTAAATRAARLACNRRGAVAMLAALFLSVLLFFSGLTVDIGLALLKKRQLQAATDAAAMAAAQNLTTAQTAASVILGANGFAAAKITSLTTGNYSPNPAVAPAQRFVAGQAPQQALRLSTSFVVPLYFIRAVVPNASLTVTANSGGVAVAEAGLNAGSGLVSINGGLENAILGQALGTQVSLDAVSYQGLANTQINALDFLNALATQANVTSGTYGNLLSTSLSVGRIMNAEVAALTQEGNGSSAAATALVGLAQALTASASVPLSALFNAGPWSNATIGSINANSTLQSALNTYQLTSFVAQIANGSHLIQIASATSIAGIASVDLALTAVEPAQGSYYAVGPSGLTVHTSQVRALLSLHLLNLLPILIPAPVTLQIYVEVANGTATLQSVACSVSPSRDAVAVVSATSGLTNAFIGNVSPTSVMSNFSQPVTPVPSAIVNVLGLTVTGYAEVSTAGNAATLTFNRQQIASLTPQTVTSTNMTSNLLQSLQSKMVLQSSLPLITLTPLLTPLLTPVFAALDSLVDQILRTLGVRVGYLDVTVNGDRCGIPALMQ